MRLFIAIGFNREIMRALTKAQEAMRRQGVRGNYTKAENLHLTLAFIGEYPDPQAVVDLLPEFDAFPLALEGLGAFGDLWWAGLEPSAALEAYVRRLRRALSDADVTFDRKRFSPHVTLVRRAMGRPEIRAPRGGMRVSRVSVMRSDRGADGMIYTEVGGVDARDIALKDE